MLETIREFGLEQLEDEDGSDEVRIAHARHFGALEQAAQQIRIRPEWYEHLAVDYSNIREALRCLLDRNEPDLELRAATTLHLFWAYRGMTAEEQRWLEAGIANAREPETRLAGKRREAETGRYTNALAWLERKRSVGGEHGVWSEKAVGK